MNLRVTTIPQVIVDPLHNIAGASWLLTEGLVGSPGQAMGVMGLTYTQPVANTYTYQIKTNEGIIVGFEVKGYV